MPARGLVITNLRPWISSSVARRSSASQKWRPLPGLATAAATRAFQPHVARLPAQQPDREHRPDSDQKHDDESPLVQRDPFFIDSLYRRLKNPKRSKGYEGNHFTPKDKKKPFSPQPSASCNDHAVKGKLPKQNLDWRARETKELEEYLQHVAHTSPSVTRVHALLRELVVRRAVKPTVSHYEALILSNCDAGRGSIQAVKAVLQEMERENIATGTAIFEAVLKVDPRQTWVRRFERLTVCRSSPCTRTTSSVRQSLTLWPPSGCRSRRRWNILSLLATSAKGNWSLLYKASKRCSNERLPSASGSTAS